MKKEKYVDLCTPEERLRRQLFAMKRMDEAYDFVPDMVDCDEDYALMKYLGTKPEDIPGEEDRKKYSGIPKKQPVKHLLSGNCNVTQMCLAHFSKSYLNTLAFPNDCA